MLLREAYLTFVMVSPLLFNTLVSCTKSVAVNYLLTSQFTSLVKRVFILKRDSRGWSSMQLLCSKKGENSKQLT